LPAELRVLVSNRLNCFEDPNDEESDTGIHLTLQARKKAHPEYTGELSLRLTLAKLFLNYDPELILSILDRLHPLLPHQPLSPHDRDRRVVELLAEALLEDGGIEEKYRNAGNFEFHRSYVEIEKYRQLFASQVLLQLELHCEEVELFLLNSRTHCWLDRIVAEGISLSLHKSPDFCFLKAGVRSL
jgi:hypothetical protein